MLDGKRPSYTVIGPDRLPIRPAQEYLSFLRNDGASPNTIKTYAYGLAAWWTVLECTGAPWDDFPTSLFGSYLHFLRTGDLPGTARIGPASNGQYLSPKSLQPRAAAVLSLYRYFADAHDLTAPYRRLFTTNTRARRRSPYIGFLDGVGPRTDGDQPIYRQRASQRTETPVLEPGDVAAILDTCSTHTPAGWTGSPACLRDRLYFAVLAETGMRMGEALCLRHNDFHIDGGDTPYIDLADRDDHPHGLRAKSGPRRIYIGDDLVTLYTEYVWQLVERGADLAVDDLSTHFVFVNLTRGTRYAALRPETVYDRVDAIKRRRPDLPPAWTPHWFRHTHATALLFAGVDPHVVMRRLGHRDIQTTLNTYGWVTRDAEMRSISDWRNFAAGWKGIHDGHP